MAHAYVGIAAQARSICARVASIVPPLSMTTCRAGDFLRLGRLRRQGGDPPPPSVMPGRVISRRRSSSSGQVTTQSASQPSAMPASISLTASTTTTGVVCRATQCPRPLDHGRVRQSLPAGRARQDRRRPCGQARAGRSAIRAENIRAERFHDRAIDGIARHVQLMDERVRIQRRRAMLLRASRAPCSCRRRYSRSGR